jgi:hypothetical protein
MRRVAFAVALLCACASAANAQSATERAEIAVREANRLYQKQDFQAAAVKYEEVIALDPTLTYALFFLGNSYDQFRPAKRGDTANDALLTKAVENYR